MRRRVVWTMATGLVLLAAAAAEAQQTGTITGRVTDAVSQAPLAGAQVVVVGTERGNLSNPDGRYIILNVPAGTYTVRVLLLGYGTTEQEVTVSSGGTVEASFQLREEAIALQGLVVTALGIQREERGLGYAVQGVTSETLDRIPEVNLVQALQGQTAGVQVIQASGRPGATSRIEIRGNSTFTGSGQPLFVIDGVPVSTDLDTNQGRGELGYGQAGNRAMDFDMSNVEEISILRGAAATALYGSRAAAGAVVITTKKGQAGAPLRFEINSSTSWADPIIEGYVTDWAAGRDRLYCNGFMQSQGGYCQPGYPGGFETRDVGNYNYPGWGPHKDSIPAEVIAAVGPISFQDAREQYYRTARTYENSIRASGSLGEGGAYTMGISHLNQGDIIPTGQLERLNLSANMSLRLSDYLQSSTSIQRIHTFNPWPNESWNGVHHALLHVPPNVDLSRAWLEDGSPVLFGPNNPHLEWVAENEYEESNVDRWIVSQRFAFTLPAGLTLTNTVGLDTYLDDRRRFMNERPWRTAQGLASGGTTQEKVSRSQMNDDLVLSHNGVLLGETGLTLSGLVGGNVWMTERSRITGSGTNIVIPDYYNVGNFQTQRIYADLPEKKRIVGLYGQATVDYEDWAYLTVTGRNDWSSTLPKHANNYFYPSVALGVIFTDALDWHPAWLPYGKLRLSYAKVGNDAPPYSLSSVYTAASAPGISFGHYQFSPTDLDFPFQGQVAFFQGNQLGNPNIKPESTSEYEAGLELRLLDNRARVDVSYYEKKSYDQIFEVPSSAASGYTSIVRNAGDLRNKGWEVQVQGRALETRDLTVDLRANWTRNRNEVISLAEGVDNITLAGYDWPSIRIMEGLPYAVIWGYGFQRNCDPLTGNYCFPDQPEGALILGDEDCISDRGGSCYGLPLRTESQIPLGSALPDWLANFSTQIRYKGFGLSSLWDVRRGSRILNFEIQYTTGRNGRHILTEDRYTIATVEGIDQTTGQPSHVELVKTPEWYDKMYGYDRHENQIEPGGFVKLRELTLSYDLPRAVLDRVGVQGGTVYVTGRNVAVWSDFSMGDPEGDVYGGTSGATQYFRQFPAPQTKGLTVGLRARF